MGGVAFFAGDHSLVAVDVLKGKLHDAVFETGCSFTNSLLVCHVSESKVYLSIVGENSLCSSEPDFLDVTAVYLMKGTEHMKVVSSLSDFGVSRVNTLMNQVITVDASGSIKENTMNRVSLVEDLKQETRSDLNNDQMGTQGLSTNLSGRQNKVDYGKNGFLREKGVVLEEQRFSIEQVNLVNKEENIKR